MEGLQQLLSALQGGTSSRSSKQLHAIQSLQDTLTGWTRKMTTVVRTDRLSDNQKMWADRQLAPPTPRVPIPYPTEGTQPPRVLTRPAPRVPKQTSPRVQEPQTQPVAHRTRSARAQAPTSDPTTVVPTAPTQPVAQRTCSRYSLTANLLADLPVLDKESGKLLEHRQLRRHPRLKETWETSYANKLGRLCQGIGKGTAGPAQQRVKGTSTFRVIHYDDIPSNKLSDIYHTRFVCGGQTRAAAAHGSHGPPA